MIHSTAESQPDALANPIETIYAAELFSKLPADFQDELITLLKSLLSHA